MDYKELQQLKELLWKASVKHGGELLYHDEVTENENRKLQDAWMIIKNVNKKREFQGVMSMRYFDK